jgi:ATP-binding cassette subfamily B protein
MLLRILGRYSKPYRHWLLVVVLCQAGSTAAMLYLPTLNGHIIDRGIVHHDTHYILSEGGIMLAIALAQAFASVIAVWFSARTAMAVGRDLRAAIFARVGSFSAREVNQFGAPSLITRSTNDVQQLQMLLLLFCTMAVMVPIMMVGTIAMAINEDVKLSWLFAAVVPALVLSVALIASRMVPNFRVMQVRIDAVNKVLREQIMGIRVVRAFVREPHETTRFDGTNDELTQVAIAAGRWQALMFPLVLLVVNVGSLGVMWFGGHRVADGMPIGNLTVFLSYLMQAMMSVMMGTFMLMQIPRAAVCADRVDEVLSTESSVIPPTHGVVVPADHGTIEFDRVGFTYPGAETAVLDGVTFSAEPGQTVAVIGSTGAGKTTLVNLVSRLFDATEGSVRLGGVDVRDIAPESLATLLGLVPQKAFLFSGTVRSNLLYGKPDATDEELWHALKIAQAADFVASMPEGLDASIAQGGTNVSGGQRQRLAIARALVRRPAIYLFDDSFSALDLATDARLRTALKPETRDATVIIVAQRVSTIRDADLILVLEDGVIVGRGTHDQLLAENPTYQEIVESQLSAEEAA